MGYLNSEKPLRIARSIKNKSSNILYNINNIINFLSRKIKETLSDRNEVFLIFINILLFMIIQTIFFNEVISKEYDMILAEKTHTMQHYISSDEEIKTAFIDFKTQYLADNKTKKEEQARERTEKNWTLYTYYCIIPIICVFVLFIVINLLVKFKDSLSGVQIFNFFLILFVYIPEVIIFMFVVKKYQFVGNIDILSRIYNNLNKNNINKN
jgi:hypothetical protein